LWFDADRDGTQDDGEATLEGATVTLLNADGSVFDSDAGTPGIQSLEVVTNAAGEYNFNGLPEGEYRVQVDLTDVTNVDGTRLRPSPVQVADPNASNSNTDSNVDVNAAGQDIPNNIYQSGIIALAVGEEPTGEVDGLGAASSGDVDQPNQGATDLDANGNMTLDLGFVPTGQIGDLVFADIDANGILDTADGDVGFGGVTVTLTPPLGVDLGNGVDQPITTTTAIDGSYLFDGLPPGDGYVVTVDTTTLPGTLGDDIRASSDPDDVLDNTSTVDLEIDPVDGQVIDDLDQDFGYVPLGTIGDTIWYDTNRDGIQDADEVGIEGVTVQLTLPGGGTQTLVTDQNGQYLFENLPAGDYQIDVIDGLLPEFTQTGDPDGTLDNQSTVTLEVSNTGPAGTPEVIGNLAQDFGYVEPVSIGSFVWSDLNNDGVQDASEPPISGAQVVLQVSDGAGGFTNALDLNGNPASTTSALDGTYLFDNLPSGDYRVVVTPPAGFFPGAVQTTTDDDPAETDSNIAGAGPTANSFASGVFTLQSPFEDPTTAEPVEAGTARGDNQDAGGSPTTARDESGNMTVDFGFIPSASLGNYVWLDLDMDGVQDANEEGIPGVTVNLLVDTNGNGVIDGAELTTPAETAVTGPDGGYLFPDLEPGVAYVAAVDPLSLPPNLVQTYDEGVEPGSLGTLNNSSESIVLDPGEEHLTADFGYAPPLGSIGDTIWVDADNDGVQDPGEPGIPNVDVSITPPPDVDIGAGPGQPITVTTDANGKYLFTDLPLDETYIVTVDETTLPDDYVLSDAGDPDVRDENSTVGDNQTTVVLTTEDPVNLDADFGYLPPDDQNNSIGDTLWIDADQDGNGPGGAGLGTESDDNELPLAGVTIALMDSDGTVIATTITDANGQYLFTGIPDGDYTVIITDQNNVLDGLSPTFDPEDGVTSTPATPNVSQVIGLGVGVDTPVANLDQDFGYVDTTAAPGVGTIGDTVFFDQNESGAPESGEGIEGVTVNLFGPGPDGDITTTNDNVLLATQQTDENGNYLFTGLETSAGGVDYEVVVDTASLPNGGTGWVNSVDPDGGTDRDNPGDSRSFSSLTDAEPEDLLRDFGYIGGVNSLSGTVWPDTNGDGVLVEAGQFVGVTIELRDQNGNIIGTTTTDANGDYMFNNLPDGIYTVVVTDEQNVLNGFEHTDSPNGPTDTSDLTSKDDTGYVVDLDSAGASTDPVVDTTGDFGYQPTITNPISLGSFSTTAGSNGTVIANWVTQTEVANLGFNLYGLVDGEWVQLNDGLVLGKGDSVTLQNYQLAVRTNATAFSLSDIDLTGKETLHGPFLLGEQHGMVADRRSIDWSAERAARQAQREAREAARKARQRERQEQRKQRQLKRAQQQQETSMYNNKAWYVKPIAAMLSAFVPVANAAQSSGDAGEDVVNVTTTVAGIHALSHADLLSFEVDLSGVPVVDLAMMNNGAAVPIYVQGSDADRATFGDGSVIHFVADAIDTLYTDTNVYTLRLDQDDALRMNIASPAMPRGAAANAYLATAKFAPQQNYSFVSPNRADPWYAKRIVAVGEPESDTVSMTLDNVAVGGNSGRTAAKLSVDVWGSTDLPGAEADHHVMVSVNGVQVTESRFDGLAAKRMTSDLNNIVEGANKVTVELPMDTGQAFDAVNVNEVTIRYPRQFMASDNRLAFESSLSKFRIQGIQAGAADKLMVVQQNASGTTVIDNPRVACRRNCLIEFGSQGGLAQYYVSANPHTPGLDALPLEQDINSGSASYLIISHPDFIDNADLQSLATELSDEFGSADIIDVEAIYAQYGNHVFDPTAIQDYIRFSVANRDTEMVLLVGGDVYDYRRFETEDAESFIPSLYAATGNNITFAPVDAKYVDLDNDNVPDLPIGRLPVRTNGQLNALLSKRDAFINRDYPATALLVADEYDEIQQYDFANDAEEISGEYLQNWSTNTVYVDDVVGNGGSIRQARSEVTSQINQGQTLTAFFGHSSTNQWAFNGLFTGPDAANLQNQGRPTVVTQWGCWNAYYVSPAEDSMGHRFMMEGEQGAVAVMGASTLTNADAERQLARKVFARLANGERLGHAITNAKQDYAQDNPTHLDVLLGWTLLGLPELFVN